MNRGAIVWIVGLKTIVFTREICPPVYPIRDLTSVSKRRMEEQSYKGKFPMIPAQVLKGHVPEVSFSLAGEVAKVNICSSMER